MSEQPKIPSKPDPQDDLGWSEVAHDMQNWHPGLQAHAKRELAKRGFEYLIPPESTNDTTEDSVNLTNNNDNPQQISSSTLQIQRLVRPTEPIHESNKATTMYIKSPSDIPLLEVFTEEMKNKNITEFILGYNIDEADMEKADQVAEQLYRFCVGVMG